MTPIQPRANPATAAACIAALALALAAGAADTPARAQGGGGPPLPVSGQSWYCNFGSPSPGVPHVILTRDPGTGQGYVLFSDTQARAEFSVLGLFLVWRWNEGRDVVRVRPDGSATYTSSHDLTMGEMSLPMTCIDT